MKRTIKITESQMRKIIDRISEGEYHMDEVETKTMERTTYSKTDVDQARNSGVGIKVDDGTVTPTKDGGLEVTKSMSETEELLDEDIFEEDKEITSWDDVPMA